MNNKKIKNNNKIENIFSSFLILLGFLIKSKNLRIKNLRIKI